MPLRRRGLTVGLVLSLLVGASASAQEPAPSGAISPAPMPAPTGIPYEPSGPAPFSDGLVTTSGTPFRLSDLAGRPTLVYFGYTHCPDVCPATMGELIGVIAADPSVHVVFVTIDPERDTPEFLGQWIAYLPDQIVGVTGDTNATRAVADAWGVRYAKVETGSAAGYSMSHTAWVYLVDPAGRLITRYPFGTPAQVMVDDLAQLPTS